MPRVLAVAHRFGRAVASAESAEHLYRGALVTLHQEKPSEGARWVTRVRAIEGFASVLGRAAIEPLMRLALSGNHRVTALDALARLAERPALDPWCDELEPDDEVEPDDDEVDAGRR